MRFHTILQDIFLQSFSCTCTRIIPVYRPNIMVLVKDVHIIAKGHIEVEHCLRPPQPLVPRPKGTFASLSEFQSTSEVGKEARTAIGENLESMFYGVDVGMKRQRAEANSRATFVDKTYADLDAMSAEEVLAYSKFCRDGWKKVIQNDDPNR
jgi:hypothetical protein